MNPPVPAPSPLHLLLLHHPASRERSRNGRRSGFKRPCPPGDPSPLPSTLGKASGGGVARPSSPGRAESRRGARHRADPAAAPGSGGQTWQRPGSAATTWGSLPPGWTAPPPPAPGSHPGAPPGAAPREPAGANHRQLEAPRAPSPLRAARPGGSLGDSRERGRGLGQGPREGAAGRGAAALP